MPVRRVVHVAGGVLPVDEIGRPPAPQIAHGQTKQLRTGGEREPQLDLIDRECHGGREGFQRDELLPALCIALSGEMPETSLLQRFDGDKGIGVPQHDQRFSRGNAIDDQLENSPLILRGCKSWKQQERDQPERRESLGAQRGHTPFGVCSRSCSFPDANWMSTTMVVTCAHAFFGKVISNSRRPPASTYQPSRSRSKAVFEPVIPLTLMVCGTMCTVPALVSVKRSVPSCCRRSFNVAVATSFTGRRNTGMPIFVSTRTPPPGLVPVGGSSSTKIR